MIKQIFLKIFCCILVLSIPLTTKSKDFYSDDVQNAINDLLISCSQKSEILYDRPLASLLDFALKQNEYIQLPDKENTLGLFTSYTINTNIQTIIRYLSDPFIPKEIFFPSQIRTSYIINELDLSSENTKLWDLKNNDTLSLHLEEYVASTVQPESGSWYGYLQNSIRIRSSYNDQTIFCIVESQKGESAMGRKGYIVGLDMNHNYIYSNQIGSANKYLSWCKSKIDVMDKITIFYPINEKECKIFVFSWLSKSLFDFDTSSYEDIKAKSDRQYLSFIDIIKNPNLPDAKDITNYRIKLDKKSDLEIDELLKNYNSQILAFAEQLDLVNDDNFKELFTKHNYLEYLSRSEKISIIMQEFTYAPQ